MNEVQSDKKEKEKEFNRKRYSFQNGWYRHWLLNSRIKEWVKNKNPDWSIDNLAVFVNNLQLKTTEDGKVREIDNYEKDVIQTFLKVNVDNIDYYRKRLRNENMLRKFYGWTTGLLVMGVPVLIFWYTDKAAKENVGVDQAEALTSSIAALLAGVLGLHKLVTSWIEKRKHRSNFHQAQAALMNILFALEQDFLYNSTEESYESEGIVNLELIDALKAGIVKSREIVNAETVKFFELSGAPSFDLASTLTSSLSSAKSIFESSSSKRFKLEQWQKEAQDQATKEEAEKKETFKNETSLKTKILKMRSLIMKEESICLEINSLRELKDSDVELSSSDEKKLERLDAKFDLVENELEKLEFDCLELRATLGIEEG